jgi:hypothetical protein
MHMLRLLNSKRMIICIGLLGLFALSSGCGGDVNATVRQPTAEEKEHQDAERAARAKAYAKGMPVGKGGMPVTTRTLRSHRAR